MTIFMNYKGYCGAVQYSDEDSLMVGTVLGIRDSLNFHGQTVAEITQSFHDSIDGYLDMCKKLGRSPDKEYKGSFNVRMSPQLHRRAVIAAESNGMTLNQFVQRAVEKQLNPSPARHLRLRHAP